jgi:hypothetical protein
MEGQPSEAAAKAIAFANGLRKNTLLAGRRWAPWPGGAQQLAEVITRIDGIQQRLRTTMPEPPIVAAAIADLRAILEWTTYQTAGIATARALLFARKTRTFAERLGLLEDPAASLSILVDSEQSLIDNVAQKNSYMVTIAERHPHLALPPPLVDAASLIERATPPPPTGRLVLMQQLIKSAKRTPRNRK